MFKYIFYTLGAILTLCGFADCQFSATNASFKIDMPCSELAKMKVSRAQDKIKIQKTDFKEKPGVNVYQCKKFASYHISEEIQEKRIITGDVVVGLQGKMKDCTIITSWPHVGPVTGDEEDLQGWHVFQRKYAEEIFGLHGKLQNLSQSATFVKGKEDYQKWCESTEVDYLPEN